MADRPHKPGALDPDGADSGADLEAAIRRAVGGPLPPPRLTPARKVERLEVELFPEQAEAPAERKSAPAAERVGTAPAAVESEPPAGVGGALPGWLDSGPSAAVEDGPLAVLERASPDWLDSAPAPTVADAPPEWLASAPEPVVESAPEPVQQSAPEPVQQSAPEPVVESAPEPALESAPEPALKSAPEPVLESAPEPVAESAPAEEVGSLAEAARRASALAQPEPPPPEARPELPPEAEVTFEPPPVPSEVRPVAVAPVAPVRPAAPAAQALGAARAYRVAHTAQVLGFAAVAVLVLDSEGLLTWARRLEVGRLRAAALAVLSPAHEALESVGATGARRALDRAADLAGGLLRAREDPLLASGWSAAVPEHPDAPEPELPLDLPDEEDLPPSELRLLGEPVYTGDAPPLDEELRALPAPGVARPDATGVLLLGDSMIAGSLGTALNRTLSQDTGLRLAQAFQTATGLARPDVFDWMRVATSLVARERPGFVIASFGANDATNLLAGDERVDYGTARWRALYRERVLAMMRTLSTGGARVLWLGLPPMRDKSLSARAVFLNRIYADCARRVPRVEFLPLDMLVSEGDGAYTTFRRSAQGTYVRMRLDDGVHYAPAGARVIARWANDWIRERRSGRREP